MAAREPLLMVADSEHDANMLYATGVFVPDAFVFLRTGGRDYVIVSDLEIDRIRRQAPHCKALPLGEYLARLRTQGLKNPGLAEVIPLALRELRVTGVTVPWNFPHGLALDLAKAKVRVRVRPGTFFPEREEKTADEVKKISAALMMAEIGMDEAMQVLKACKIGKDRRLLHRNVPLTSEKLRSVIDTAILNANGLASHTIVAGGRQGCDPHEIGHGPL
ncbi:MAG TPA: aminopeptidase P family protein, partial [Verrucomicrobiae bacterium]|nr:aminopeptidase P family protein [Verrucomicrobiae bacterium]